MKKTHLTFIFATVFAICITLSAALAIINTIDDKNLNQLGKKVIMFTVHGKELDVTNFSEKELNHIYEVKHLINTLKRARIAILILSIALIFLGAKDTAALLKTAKTALIATASFGIMLLAYALINFKSLFTLFHFVAFSSKNWQLDLGSALLDSFPTAFFKTEAIRLFGSLLVPLLIMALLNAMPTKLLKKAHLTKKMRTIVNINIGKQGITEQLIKEIKRHLERKKLVKIKLLRSCEERKNKKIAVLLEKKTGAKVVKKVGFTFLIKR